MTTVFLVDGFLFKGALAQIDIVKRYRAEGATVVQFAYDNLTPTTANITSTATRLRDTATQVTGPVVFIGVSMGSQVLCALLRQLGTFQRGDWTFLLLANPEHKWTGKVQTPKYGGQGIPADTPYTVTDVAAQYDSYADYPNANNLTARAARLWVDWVGGGVHTFGYFTMDPDLPFHYVQEGNIRHMWATTTQQSNNTLVERGYNRPVKPGRA